MTRTKTISLWSQRFLTAALAAAALLSVAAAPARAQISEESDKLLHRTYAFGGFRSEISGTGALAG